MSLRRVLALGIACLAAGTLAGADATTAANPASAAPGAPAAAPKPAIESGPAVGWTLPLFTDKEGYRLLTLRGSSARPVGSSRIDVTDFSAFSFSGDARERVETVLLSPQASFFPKENKAAGSSTVRMIHDDIEVTGRGWTYEHGRERKKVSLSNDVRVTFDAQLNDILK